MPDLFLPFVARRRHGVRNPLLAFYGAGAGKIDLHLAPDGATLAAGSVVALPNRGGMGEAGNAPVSGNAISRAGAFLSLVADSGVPALAAPLDLTDRRLFFVLRSSQIASGMKIFGHNATPGYEVRLLKNLTDVRPQIWTNEGGSGQTMNPGGWRTAADGNPHLVEIEIHGGKFRSYIDAVALGEVAFAWSAFLVSRFGRGMGGTTPFLGDLGDMITVVQGTGADAAIAAVRAFLSQKFGLSLSL